MCSVFLLYLIQFEFKVEFQTQRQFRKREIKSFRLAPRLEGLNVLLIEISAPKVLVKVICPLYINLWPGEKSLIAKVEDEAAVHDVFTLNPRHSFTHKFKFFFIS